MKEMGMLRVPGYGHNFAQVVAVEGTAVALRFDLDAERWPWLSLPPQHPVLLEKYQYFGAVTAGLATGVLGTAGRSALTRLHWRCPVTAETAAEFGQCESWTGEGGTGFRLALSAGSGEPVVRIDGEGAIFDARDFDRRRAAARSRAASAPTAGAHVPATPTAVGLAAGGVVFVGCPEQGVEQGLIRACVGRDTAFFPKHPFHTGTGDHVNAGHLFDCVLQAAHLLWPEGGDDAVPPCLQCVAGDARFLRFVELDLPFEIRLSRPPMRRGAASTLSFGLTQGGREVASISLTLRSGPPG